jgi:hypothetical protein
MSLRLLASAALVLCVATPGGAGAQGADSALARVERLAISQDRAAARVLADSLVGALASGDPQYADALYWRGFASSNAADAERDYLRVSIEFSLSPRAPDALLALAQLEFARGDRTAARRRFDRLLRDYPSGRHVARASYWSGRLAMDEGDDQAACSSLRGARLAVAANEVELINQIEYLLGQCAIPVAPRPDTTASSQRSTGQPQAGRTFSVQVAAFTARNDANALVTQLTARGFDVRVVGTRAPYRVRIGRYPTRAAAVAELPRIRAAGLPAAFVVEAEPP